MAAAVAEKPTTETKNAPVTIAGFAVETVSGDEAKEFTDTRRTWNFQDFPLPTNGQIARVRIPEADVPRARAAAGQAQKKNKGLKIRTKQIKDAEGNPTGDVWFFRVQ